VILSQCYALHTLPILFMQIIISHMASIFSGQISVWMTIKLWYQTTSLLSSLMKLYWKTVFSFLRIGYNTIIWYSLSLVMTSVFPNAVCHCLWFPNTGYLITHTNTCTHIYYLRSPKFTIKHLKRSYMFRSHDHPQGAYIVPC